MDKLKMMTCTTDKFNNLDDFYTQRVAYSPAMDGTNTQIANVNLNDVLMKAEQTTADTGSWNHIYSYGVFTQYATKANTFGVLPKRPWSVDGYRALTTAGISSGGGVAENADLATAVQRTYVEVAPDPKEYNVVADFSNRLSFYTGAGDAISVDDDHKGLEQDFFKTINADITQDNDTLASANFESIDRVVGSYAEITGGGQTAGDLDIYGLDRDAAETWADANVSHGSTTDRDLSVSLWNDMREGAEPYWETGINNKVFITGYDTATTLSEIEAAKQRLGTETVQITVGDGIQTMEGATAGMKIATWEGMPLIPDDNIQQDTISRAYLLDLDNIGMATGIPFEFAEVDGRGRDAAIVGFKNKGWWYGMAELYCTNFKTQSKLRDLQ